MDNVDFANALVQERMDQALAARKPVFVGHSYLYCESCNGPIPVDRRLALGGCTKCFPCQVVAELMEARNA